MESVTDQFVDYVSYLTKEKKESGAKIKRAQVIKGKQVNLAEKSEAISSNDGKDKPHLVVYRNRGVVESIEITCICGHQLKVDLVYPDIQEVVVGNNGEEQ